MKHPFFLLLPTILLTHSTIARADQIIAVNTGVNYYTCQVAGGPVNTILNTNIPLAASDPGGYYNWLLYTWDVTNQTGRYAQYWTADDIRSTGCLFCGFEGDGWYNENGVKVSYGLTQGQGFAIVRSSIGSSSIPLVGSPAAIPPYTYSPTQFNLVGSPVTLPDSPPVLWTNIVSPPPINGEAIYITKSVFPPFDGGISPLAATMYYYDSEQGGWVPSEPMISPANMPEFVGPSPKTVKGTVYKDPSGNFTKSSGVLPNWTVKLTSSNGGTPLFGMTDQNGRYAIVILPGTSFAAGILTATPISKSGWTQSVDIAHPAVYTPTHAFSGSFSLTNDFWERPPTPGNPHLSVDLTSVLCLSGQYIVSYANDGDIDLNGVALTLTLPGGATFAPGQDSVPPNVGHASVSGNDLTWTISPTTGSSGFIYVPVTFAPDATISSAVVSAMGAPANSAFLNPGTGCFSSDMQATPTACGLAPVGAELTYVIQFEDTYPGLSDPFYPVYQVVVTNTLPTGLDPSTVEVVSSSHRYGFQTNGQQLVWTFPAIYLLHTNDVTRVFGHLKYKVKSSASAPSGTVINNQASIYYDLNPPRNIGASITLTTNAVPIAAFSNSPAIGSAGFTNDFTYTGGTTGATFNWNFGSNATPSTSTSQNPTGVVFASAGNRIVTLQVTLGGCTSDPAVAVVHTGLPALNAQLLGGQLALSWQGDGFHLQETATLNPADWSASGLTPTQSGPSFFVTAPIGEGARYYRLSQVPP